MLILSYTHTTLGRVKGVVGYDPPDLVGTRVMDYMHPVDYSNKKALIEKPCKYPHRLMGIEAILINCRW